MGLPGSGKSTIGKILSKKLKFPFHDMDDLIPAFLIKKLIKNKILSNKERNLFFADFSRKLGKIKGDFVATGYVAKSKHRKLIKKICKDLVFINLEVPYDTIKNRLKNRSDHFVKEEIFDELIKTSEFEPIKLKHIAIDASKNKIAIVNQILKKIKQNQTN